MIIGKKELRKYITELKTLHAASTTRLSDDILKRIEVHPVFQKAKTVLLYHSLPDEVNTHDFIRKWYMQKRILLPVVTGNTLELYTYTGPDNMQTGAYGIAEPIGEKFNNFKEIDLAIIPGMAFDRRGNRLGRGKGYYDRLLPFLAGTYKLGVCFPYQLLESIPTENFDVRMNEVIY
ncbi:MAG TPA: 5-formyltetrahydrofolate cyclo-ligase [Candidatus Bacteroides merdavium]|uniref:5-formyltetrahydrofolate cyclo-ligase n=1 Tax=Candidatus Bacteroides merdavium TaxID=2838472 RepID=A0A9D2KCL4_9BACE|nr:5-formyltetrahydrofolate cyclo-ligase [uncultured Bacteroides sp.]HIZ91654.1 5-formyltetrahydrofolate cyclo-ligase [Candidatus Bacteroides merdavium]